MRFTGLGDRHLENYLVKESDGELVCIGELMGTRCFTRAAPEINFTGNVQILVRRLVEVLVCPSLS